MTTETAAFDPMAPLVLKLSAPIKTHKGEVRELEFKPITARAFTAYGSPFREYTSGPRENRETRMEYMWPAVMGFAHLSTGYDIPTLEGINAADMFGLANKVVELITRSPND